MSQLLSSWRQEEKQSQSSADLQYVCSSFLRARRVVSGWGPNNTVSCQPGPTRTFHEHFRRRRTLVACRKTPVVYCGNRFLKTHSLPAGEKSNQGARCSFFSSRHFPRGEEQETIDYYYCRLCTSLLFSVLFENLSESTRMYPPAPFRYTAHVSRREHIIDRSYSYIHQKHPTLCSIR